MGFDIIQFLAAFMVLFAVIDITGSIPIIVSIRNRGQAVHAGRATVAALLIMLVFLWIGEPLLGIFGVDISSFAIAGSVILLFLALEMVLGVQIFKDQTSGSGTIVPIAFPLVAGAGSITTLLSLKAEYATTSILGALIANMALVYLVLRLTGRFERFLGPVGIHVLRKAFGIILLAIAIKLFLTNTGIHLPMRG